MNRSPSDKNRQSIDIINQNDDSASISADCLSDDPKRLALTRNDSPRLADTREEPLAAAADPRCNVGDGVQVSAQTEPRSAQSIASYRARWPSLFRLATGAESTGQPTVEHVLLVADWLREAAPSYRATAYRQYRAALLQAAKDVPGATAEDRVLVIERLEAGEALPPESVQAARASLPLRTSAKKKKRIADTDFDIIKNRLDGSKLRSDRELLIFLSANMVVGLRPVEWANAELSLDDAGQAVLKIANAKNSQGRANGDQRTLVFTLADTPNALATLAPCLDLAKRILDDVPTSKQRPRWSSFCRALGDRFRTINHEIWPHRRRHYSLYSTRHTMLALAKTVYGPVGVAALAGHASDETATRHYARPPKGKGKSVRPVPQPTEAEMATVRRRLDFTRLEAVQDATARQKHGYKP